MLPGPVPLKGAMLDQDVPMPATSCMQRALTSSLCCCLQGVGSHAAHLLLRSGVGRLRLVDFDQVITVSNHDISSCVEGHPRSDLPQLTFGWTTAPAHACSLACSQGACVSEWIRWLCCSALPPAPVWTGAQVVPNLWGLCRLCHGEPTFVCCSMPRCLQA